MVHRTYAEIEVEYIDPEMLKPAVYNPRKISEAEMKKLILLSCALTCPKMMPSCLTSLLTK